MRDRCDDFKVVDQRLIDQLANLFEDSLRDLVGSRRVNCLADFPNHSNVGDSAIFLGELAALRKLNLIDSATAVFDLQDASMGLDKLPPTIECILIHGGGNFGDLYPAHQELRLRLLERFSACRIIQLPQSISFSDSSAIARSRAVIAAHPDFHLMVRDRESESFARDNFGCPTYLVPDAALSLRKIPRSRAFTEFENFGLLRSDKERVAYQRDQLGVDIEEDWIDEGQSWLIAADQRLKKLLNNYPSMQTLLPLRLIRFWLYERLAIQRVARGVAQLSRGKLVTTDRLHGHIICTLMSIRHVTLDNSTGKITSFRRAWGT